MVLAFHHWELPGVYSRTETCGVFRSEEEARSRAIQWASQQKPWRVTFGGVVRELSDEEASKILSGTKIRF